MIEIMEKNTKNKFEFIEILCELWNKNQIEVEIFEFICHVLKWSELNEFFAVKNQLAIENNDWRSIQKTERIFDSFVDDFENADLYKDYFKKQN